MIEKTTEQTATAVAPVEDVDAHRFILAEEQADDVSGHRFILAEEQADDVSGHVQPRRDLDVER